MGGVFYSIIQHPLSARSPPREDWLSLVKLVMERFFKPKTRFQRFSFPIPISTVLF
jgi:hypothetical protein